MRPVYTLSLTLLCLSATAQPVFFANHYATVGYEMIYDRLEGVPDSVITQSGESVSWNFAVNGANNLSTAEVLAGSNQITAVLVTMCDLNVQTQNHSIFNCLQQLAGSDILFRTPDMFSLGPVETSIVGRYGSVAENVFTERYFLFKSDTLPEYITAGIINFDPDTILTFPIIYGDTYTSQNRWSIDFASLNIPFAHSSSQYKTIEVDGWGILSTPYDTFSHVLRVRTETLHHDTVRTATEVNISTYRTAEYAWYDTAFGLPVAIIKSAFVDSVETITDVYVQSNRNCPALVVEIGADPTTYFLDSTGHVTVTFNVGNSNADTYMWNYGDGIRETTTGDVTHVYTSAGTYGISLTGCFAECLPLHDCAGIYQEIEIVDTFGVSAVVAADPNTILFYPNPVQDLLIIENQLTNGQQYYIANVYGEIVSSGILNSGMNTVSFSEMPSGVYLLKSGTKISDSVLRIIKMNN